MASPKSPKALGARLADRAPWLVDLYRLAVNPGWEIATWRDSFRTHRALGWLRDLPRPGGDAPIALLVLRREDLFDVKTALMLGSAARLESVRPVVLAHRRRVPRILRHMRAFGVEDIHYRDDFLSPSDRRRVAARVEELTSAECTFAEILRWTEAGHPLGERILSTLIRETLEAAPDLSDPEVRAAMGRIAEVTLTAYAVAEQVMTSLGPTFLLADETGYAVNGPLVDVALARGVEVVEHTPYLQEGTLLLKRMSATVGRAAPASVSVDTLERLERTPWTAREDAELDAVFRERYAEGSTLRRMYQHDARTLSGEQLWRDLGLDPSRPVAVVFSQVLWDASFFYGDDLFPNYSVWLERTVRAAITNPRVQWLVKAHPSNAFRLAHGDIKGPVAEVELVRRCCGELPDHVRLLLPETHVGALTLYRHADIGVTVRGTPGLEMACLGKPVLTAGSGHYTGLGFTRDSASAEEYLARLSRIEQELEPLDERRTIRARRYAHALFCLRPWTARSFEVRLDFPEAGWHPLDRNLVPRAESLEGAEEYGDLHRWAAWLVHSRSADYLEPPDR